jgi:outer membrane protein assembly factor BamB
VLCLVAVAALLVTTLPIGAMASADMLTLSPAVGRPTTVTMATGAGFASGERVVLGFDRLLVGTIRADLDGEFTEEIGVPASATPGEHTISVTGEATATFTVRTDWPTARFVPEGTGHNPYENVLSPSTVGDLELAWSVQTDATLSTTPVVVDGLVYAAGHVVGTGGSQINAFNAATGEQLWSEKDSGQPPSDLAVANGKLYVSFLTGHILRAYDASTGDLVWELPGPTWAPTVVDGVAYAADNLRSLWAIDADIGRRKWIARAPGGYGFGLAVADDTVYVGGNIGSAPVYAYDASTGTQMWRTKTGGEVDPTPAVAHGVVYASSGDQLLYALRAQTGRVQWTADIGGPETSAPAVANGVVYLGSTNGNVYAFDADSGEALWVTPTGGSFTDSQATIVANGVVYVGSLEGTEFAFHAATGELLWSYQTGGSIRKQSVVDGTLYVTAFDTNLYAFRLLS